MSAAARVSVIVPVYNDARRLAMCLQALDRQTHPKELTQIVVVDNASQEDIRAVVALHPPALYARQPVRGPAAARNMGVGLSNGRILAFTDADCLPAADWLEKGVRWMLAHPACGLVGGRVDMFPADPSRPAPVELYEAVTYLQQRNHIEKGRFAATANMFVHREVWDAVGGFDQSFPTASGEDHEWGLRVHDRGYAQLYADDARVLHPTLGSYAGLKEKALRLERGLVQLRRMRARPAWSALAALKTLGRPFYIPIMIGVRMAREPRLATVSEKLSAASIALRIHYFIRWNAWMGRLE